MDDEACDVCDEPGGPFDGPAEDIVTEFVEEVSGRLETRLAHLQCGEDKGWRLA